MAQETAADWEELASQLHEQGGVPERRAQVVAMLAATEMSHAAVQEELGLSSRGQVSNHVRRYREEDVSQAEWLAENAPEI